MEASANQLRNPEVIVDNRKSVLVRNLPFRADDQDIVDFFAGVGTVVDIRRGTSAEGLVPWRRKNNCHGCSLSQLCCSMTLVRTYPPLNPVTTRHPPQSQDAPTATGMFSLTVKMQQTVPCSAAARNSWAVP